MRYSVRRKTSSLGRAALVSSLGVLLGLAISASHAADTTVKVGVLAKRSPRACRETWGATMEYLTAEIPGCRFTIEPLGYEEVRQAVDRDEVDFVLANPFLYAELERTSGATRILTLVNVHDGNPSTLYGGTIFCRADRTDIHRLRDLRGKRFAAVAETCFGGWQAACRELKAAGVDPHRDFGGLWFAGTHDRVVHAVRSGRSDAGTVRTGTLERMAAEGEIRLDELRVIHPPGIDSQATPSRSTRLYPEWALAKCRHTPDDLAERVAVALLELPADSAVARAGHYAGWTIPRNYQPVHECLKELRIGPYRDYGRVTLGAVVRHYWPWLAGAAIALACAFGVANHVLRLNHRLCYCEKLRADAERLSAVGRLAAQVAHEINNPLSAIKNSLRLIRATLPIDQESYEFVELAEKEVDRVSAIVRQMLDLERPAHAGLKDTNVSETVAHVVKLLESHGRRHRVRLVHHAGPSRPVVRSPKGSLEQVFYNLIVNAIEASPAGGVVTVADARAASSVRVTVADQGDGIPDDATSRVFEPFFSTKEDHATGGLGLGLPISKGLVESLGGSLVFDSRPNVGTTFTVTLPNTHSCEQGA